MMKKFLMAATTFGMLFGGAAAADKYEIDPNHAYALFSVTHLGIVPNYGRFDKVAGTINYDAADPSKSTVSIEIDASSVSTQVAKRDDHLRSPDFFNVKQFPKLTFKSNKVEKVSDTKLKVTGEFTLLGVPKPLTIEVDITGEGNDPWGNFRKGFHTMFSINRQDFGMKFMTGGLGDEVKITLAVEGIKK